MSKTPAFGRISMAEFEWRAALAREVMPPRKAEEHIAVWRLLADTPEHLAGIHARAAAADAEAAEGEDFSHLWPPKTAAEAERRRELAAHIAASVPAPADEDEEYDALIAAYWPPGSQ